MLIRPYQPADERTWLLCRLLGFFDTDYYDDVRTVRPVVEPDMAVALVATDGDRLVGLIDVMIDGHAATIDTIAVHPDAQRRGVGTALLDAALVRLPRRVRTLDAWTREDRAANSWYRSRGFVEAYRYLHVYKGGDEADDGFSSPSGLSAPVHAFLHAPFAQESELRARFARVYVCRRYLLALPR
jgi:ribosomal protein S18 acetylase RimI-like enzyme